MSTTQLKWMVELSVTNSNPRSQLKYGNVFLFEVTKSDDSRPLFQIQLISITDTQLKSSTFTSSASSRTVSVISTPKE